MQEIFSFLLFPDLLIARQVNRHFQDVANTSQIPWEILDFTILDLVITDTIVAKLAHFAKSQLFAKVLVIHLDWCSDISNRAVTSLTVLHGSTITHISVNGCTNISDSAVLQITRTCPQLRSLNIARCRVTDRGLLVALPSCINLTSLTIANLFDLTDVTLATILSAMPRYFLRTRTPTLNLVSTCSSPLIC